MQEDIASGRDPFGGIHCELVEKPAGRTIAASACPPFACLHDCIQY